MESRMEKREFPLVGGFVSETGLYWNYRLWDDGSIDGMYRTVSKEVTGGWKQIDRRSAVTKECLKAVERQFGLKTDGRRWIN